MLSDIHKKPMIYMKLRIEKILNNNDMLNKKNKDIYFSTKRVT